MHYEKHFIFQHFRIKVGHKNIFLCFHYVTEELCLYTCKTNFFGDTGISLSVLVQNTGISVYWIPTVLLLLYWKFIGILIIYWSCARQFSTFSLWFKGYQMPAKWPKLSMWHEANFIQGLSPLNFNSLPHNSDFWWPWKRSLLKTWWENAGIQHFPTTFSTHQKKIFFYALYWKIGDILFYRCVSVCLPVCLHKRNMKT